VPVPLETTTIPAPTYNRPIWYIDTFTYKPNFNNVSGEKCNAGYIKYQMVKIGNQVWMKEDLNTTCFQNGDLIFYAKSKEDWTYAEKYKIAAYCYYQFDNINYKKTKYYNWYAVSDSRKLAPLGWHIPSVSDWALLIKNCGGKNRSGKVLKTTKGWMYNDEHKKSGNGIDFYGLSIYPLGSIMDAHLYEGDKEPKHFANGMGVYTNYWSTYLHPGYDFVTTYFFTFYNDVLADELVNPGKGFPIRCVKD
jgi:uncharacterized protein (TIGR02145 family)